MKALFADSFYYLALLSAEDEAHQAARAFSAEYAGRIVTTAWVLTEVADALAGPRLRPLFIRLLAGIQSDSKAMIVGPSQALFDAGIEIYSQRLDKGWSLTDCISFALMRKRDLTDALTGDRHFEQAGFKAVLR